MELNYSLAPQAEVAGQARPWQFLKSVFALYRTQLFRWFGITAPTSLVASAVVWVADQRVRAMFRHISLFELPRHGWEMAGALTLRGCSYLLSWLLGCFALGAISSVVSGLDANDEDSAWKADSHQMAREHFGKLVLAGVLTLCVFLAGAGALGFVHAVAARVVGSHRFSQYRLAASLAGLLVVASVVSWLGMAIPLILRNSGVWAALKRSFELSNGYEGALFWLVVQSTLGTYLAAYGVYHGFSLIFPAPLQFTLWYRWLVFIVAILAGAAVEPPLFIGFSVLADRGVLNASLLPGA